MRACVDVQVYKVSIGAACGLSWPSDRIIVQVLDDSTDPVVKVHTQHKELQHAASCHTIMFMFLLIPDDGGPPSGAGSC